MQPDSPTQTSALKRGWLLIKASWAVIRSDKELLIFPVLNIILSSLLITLFVWFGYLILYATGGDVQSFSQQYDHNSLPPWAYPLIFLMLFPLFVIINYFTACVTAGALQRFRGENPTLRSSFQAVDKIAGSIVIFSLYQDAVLWVIDMLRNIKFVGSALAFLGDMAFTAATFFALPVMVDGESRVGPFEATKKSASILKQTWGETIVVSFGMTMWAILAGVLWIVVWSVGLLIVGKPLFHDMAASPAVTSSVYVSAAIVIAILAVGFGIIITVYSALSAIATTALYVFATTGTVPGGFDLATLEQSIRSKTDQDI